MSTKVSPPRSSPQPFNQARRVANLLRVDIIDGRIPPGQSLAEPVLAKLLGVSRAPIREAFLELAAEGLLEFQPNGRTRVVSLDARDFQEILELRSALETTAARKASLLWTEADSAWMCHAIAQQAHAQTLRELSTLDVEMHHFLVRRAGNRRLESLWLHIRTQFTVWLAHTHRLQDALEAAPREKTVHAHRELLDAHESRDPKKAAAAAEAHIRLWGDWMSRLFPLHTPSSDSHSKPKRTPFTWVPSSSLHTAPPSRPASP